MRVLSWDIGIKNLSYCILESIENSEIRIVNWGIINLEDSIEMKKNRNLYLKIYQKN